MKKITNIAIWGLLTLGALILLSFVGKKHDGNKCNGFQVFVDYSDDIYFLTEAEIKRLVYDEIDYIENLKLSEINIDQLEKLIEANEYVKHADAYSTIEGIIKVGIIQRIPIMRIIDRANNSFYVDKDGRTMPLKNNYTARVLVINGHIDKVGALDTIDLGAYKQEDSLQSIRLLKDAFKLGEYITQDNFWSAMIDQIYVTPNKEFELVPRIGNHVIIFGSIEHMEGKFEHLLAFYKDGIGKVGWGKYKSVNVKYENQIVCKKIKSN